MVPVVATIASLSRLLAVLTGNNAQSYDRPIDRM